ncbi:MAG: solute carrier family 23 protein, partial [Bacillota bacterium]
MSMSNETGIARYFRFAENRTDLRTEIIAGLTTFMTMAYIIVVNPGILAEAFESSLGGGGDYFGAIMIATILSTAFTTIFMGLYANYPFALAPGMGLNAYFAYVVATNPDITASTVLGAVMISGIVFLILTLIGARQMIVTAIPSVIKRSIPVGIG